MFEFHGWAVIRVDDEDEPPFKKIGESLKDQAVKQARSALNEAHDEFSDFDIRRAGNGLVVLTAHGLRNHRYEPVVELFRRLAEELPLSYGLLHVHDDEDFRRGEQGANRFLAWRLARGTLEELVDPYLSPIVPTIKPD